MKTRKRHRPEKPAPAAAAGFSLKPWHVVAGAAVASVAAFAAYQPALNGPFVFDDIYLPFYSYGFGEQPFSAVIRGVRPLLMVSFWFNHQVSGLQPYGYHFLNVLFHLFTGLFAFLIVRKVLSWAGEEGARKEWLSAFAAGLFLLHPVQTESVAYVASRSENLSVLFFYGAFALFLYRRSNSISWLVSLGVLALFGAAVTTKEHTVVLPALLLVTDYWWNPPFSFQGIRRNWRLYAPLALGAAGGLALVWTTLRYAATAGFHVEGLPWHNYLFTQWRALWVYVRLFVAPFGQNADYVFPISRSPFDHGAVFGLAGLLALAGTAWYYRRRWPLASYGFLVAVILFAPTSSLVPIQDPVAERRLYLPMIGLLFIALEFLRRWRQRPAVLAVVLAVAAILTYQRSTVWSSETALWEDVLKKTPNNARAHSHLAVAYFEAGRCDTASEHYSKAAQLEKTDSGLLLNWALADDCLNRPETALEKLKRAIALNETAHAYSLVGMVYAKQRKLEQALPALNRAIEMNPEFDMAYVYRGNVYVLQNNAAGAIGDYRRALAINPNNQEARNALIRLESRLSGGR